MALLSAAGPTSLPSRGQRRKRVFTATVCAISAIVLSLCCYHTHIANQLSLHVPSAPLRLFSTRPSHPSAQSEEAAAAAAEMAGLAEPMMSPDHGPSPPFSSSSFTHPVLLSSLPASALPGRTGSGGSRRLVVVGDVHGQLDALDALLAAVGYSQRRDTLVFAGDLVNRGPDSAGVVARAMELGARGVRGNHEDRVLRAWARHVGAEADSAPDDDDDDDDEGGSRSSEAGAGTGEEEGDAPAGEAAAQESLREENKHEHREKKKKKKKHSKSKAADLATAASLTPAQRAWLADLPVILRLGAVAPRYGDEVVVAHAGLVPGVPLARQDPRAVMTMRTLVRSRSAAAAGGSSPPPLTPSDPGPDSSDATAYLRTLRPSDGRDGRPWAEVWSELQVELARRRRHHHHQHHQQEGSASPPAPAVEPARDADADADARVATVVYGHDARAGLRVRRYAFGLDSNCARGGALTALVFEAAEEGGRDGDDDDGGGGVTHRIVSVPCRGKDKGKKDDKGGEKDEKEKEKKKKKKKGGKGKGKAEDAEGEGEGEMWGDGAL
ncbi:Metallo-dependent phosphatase-like protein [Durotheca rogersii]|uniref:Metallo-dependent phosphatase-like protein n=1 Tax=Durotheca rogersii TaxID=419775 RepID=UPI00221F65E1|nr:Metallo-dependent phosphatase-like protein [Durotheca rogersii]KAI5867844.1 Metallo-dependent phosphatase-like protein [Durotheca rogersii]